MKLSKRLLAIAELISAIGDVNIVADIGSDHGLLPTYLIKNGLCKHVYATDVAQGPIDACISTIKAHGLEDNITACLGNGLAPLLKYNEKYDVISISGMGANLICDILDAHLNDISFTTLVLQANTNEDFLREYLNKQSFEIVEERIVEDMKHTYEIIVAKFGEQILEREDFVFGPILSRQKSDIFIKKWQRELNIQKNILVQLPKDNPKYHKVAEYIEMINEVLK